MSDLWQTFSIKSLKKIRVFKSGSFLPLICPPPCLSHLWKWQCCQSNCWSQMPESRSWFFSFSFLFKASQSWDWYLSHLSWKPSVCPPIPVCLGHHHFSSVYSYLISYLISLFLYFPPADSFSVLHPEWSFRSADQILSLSCLYSSPGWRAFCLACSQLTYSPDLLDAQSITFSI